MESRLKQIRKQLELTQEDLAKFLNCSKANVCMKETGRSSLTKNDKKWLVQELNINPEWLEDGNGPMLLSETVQTQKIQYAATAGGGGVPLYNIDKIPGLAQLFRHKADFKPSGYINIPHMPTCDGAVSIVGDSMHPILRSGDLVLYSQLTEPWAIFWGDMYLVSVETSAGEYIAVRYIRKSDKKGMAVLAGENPTFADTEVELSKIRALAFVKATIRINSSK